MIPGILTLLSPFVWSCGRGGDTFNQRGADKQWVGWLDRPIGESAVVELKVEKGEEDKNGRGRWLPKIVFLTVC